MAQQKTRNQKQEDAKKSVEQDDAQENNPQSRLTVQPEFWDKLFDLMPPWGDEIAAIILIVFGIVSFLSLFDVSSNATISTAWSNALTSLFGFGSFLVAGGILGVGILILLPKAGVFVDFPARRVLAIEVAFLSLLALLHLTSGDSEWRALARVGQGGGIIGWGLSVIVGGLLSSYFALFVYSSLFIFCVAFVVGIRWHYITAILSSNSKRLHNLGDFLTQTMPKLPEPI
ncbi:MAG: hypothetical protein K8L99_17955, partial [Anaerolineae bacterium]|nr:hypothetical protein [Anaerolineae bacterium]